MNSTDLLKNFDLSNLDSFEDFQYNDFVKRMSKEQALQIIINTVEGDFSQLSDGLAEIAQIQETELTTTKN
jgi:hypothetical protein